MRNDQKVAIALFATVLSVFPFITPAVVAQTVPGESHPDTNTVLSSSTPNEMLIIDAASLSTSRSLSVAAGTVAVIDFSNIGSVTLPGDLTNHGTIYAVSNNPNIITANFTANSIYNQQNALITTMLPSAGIAGLSNLYGSLSLTLTAVQNIVNYGTISSAAELTATAGNTITNGIAADAAAGARLV